MTLSLPRLYVVLDVDTAIAAGHTVIDVARAAHRAGADMFQCRFKKLEDSAASALCQQVNDAVGRTSIVLVNGRADIAAAVEADGVHLPSTGGVVDDVREAGLPIVGRSCHSVDEARRAEDEGADFVTISPIFASTAKPGYGPLLGLGGLEEVCEAVDIPVYALAGITPDRAEACRKAGAFGVAAMSGICGAEDVRGAVAEYLSALRG